VGVETRTVHAARRWVLTRISRHKAGDEVSI